MTTIIEKTPVRFGEWGKNTALRLPKSIATKFITDKEAEYDMTLTKDDSGKLSITIELPEEETNSKFISDAAFLSGFDDIFDKYDDTFKALVDL
jgi:hypothetical protein